MRQEIIALKTSKLDERKVRQIVGEQTGDFNCFFRPADVKEGKPFNGHVHVFPPAGVVSFINQLIDMDSLEQ